MKDIRHLSIILACLICGMLSSCGDEGEELDMDYYVEVYRDFTVTITSTNGVPVDNAKILVRGYSEPNSTAMKWKSDSIFTTPSSPYQIQVRNSAPEHLVGKIDGVKCELICLPPDGAALLPDTVYIMQPFAEINKNHLVHYESEVDFVLKPIKQ